MHRILAVAVFTTVVSLSIGPAVACAPPDCSRTAGFPAPPPPPPPPPSPIWWWW